MPDYNAMLENIEKAQDRINKSIEGLVPMKKLTQMEAYLLGHLRSAQAVLEKAHDAIQSTRAVKGKLGPSAKKDPDGD